MSSSLPNRAVLVTGGSQRLGKAIVLHFAQQGWAIGFHYHRSEQEALSTASEVQALNRKCVLLQGDLGIADDRDRLLQKAISELGQLDAVVNNAALFEYDSAAEFSEAIMHQHMGPNLVAPIALALGLS